jgi:hypothetical protein
MGGVSGGWGDGSLSWAPGRGEEEELERVGRRERMCEVDGGQGGHGGGSWALGVYRHLPAGYVTASRWH